MFVGMTDDTRWYDEVVIPALLRGARHTYGSAIRLALADAGCDDIPRSGPFVLGAIARNGSPLSEIIDHLGLSKQRSGQLVDTLVARGYLEREADPADRRRMTVTLTERGVAAAATSREAVERVDADLVARVGADTVGHARAMLGALSEMGSDTNGDEA
jgi:DNA-binding MarR family transcriptional regulator